MMVQLHSVEKLKTYRDASSGEKKKKLNKLIELRKRINEHDATVLQDSLKVINTSSHIVDENYNDLLNAIRKYESYDGELEDDEMNVLAIEIVRHFSNFVGAAKSREYHTKDYVISRLEDVFPSKSIDDDYASAISRFGVDVYGEFFSDLRNIFVHERILTPTGQERGHYDRESISIERELVYKKEKLLESDEWSTEGMAIIDPDEPDEDIKIREEAELYYNAMDDLYDWFEEYLVSLFDDEMEERGEIIQEAKQLQNDIFS